MPFLLVLGAAYVAAQKVKQERMAKEAKEKKQQPDANQQQQQPQPPQQQQQQELSTSKNPVIISLLRTERELSIFELPIATMTVYYGNYQSIIDEMKIRIQYIIQANPWLKGYLMMMPSILTPIGEQREIECITTNLNNDDETIAMELKLLYDDESNITVPDEMFQVYDYNEVPIDFETTPYHEIGSLLANANAIVPNTIDYMKQTKEESTNRLPLWKVSIIPLKKKNTRKTCSDQENAQLDNNDNENRNDHGISKRNIATATTTENDMDDTGASCFGLVVSMSHIIGDAYTYYKILRMLDYRLMDSEYNYEALNVARREPNFTKALQQKFGKKHANFLHQTIYGDDNSYNQTDNAMIISPKEQQEPAKAENHGLTIHNHRCSTEEEMLKSLISSPFVQLLMPFDDIEIELKESDEGHCTDDPTNQNEEKDQQRQSDKSSCYITQNTDINAANETNLLTSETRDNDSNIIGEKSLHHDRNQNQLHHNSSTTKMVTKVFYINEAWVMKYRIGIDNHSHVSESSQPPQEPPSPSSVSSSNDVVIANDKNKDESHSSGHNCCRISQLFDPDNMSEPRTSTFEQFGQYNERTTATSPKRFPTMHEKQDDGVNCFDMLHIESTEPVMIPSTTEMNPDSPIGQQNIPVGAESDKRVIQDEDSERKVAKEDEQSERLWGRFSVTPTTRTDNIISANSIISSWFFSINDAKTGYCMVNLRNRLYEYGCNVNNLDAGNYVHPMIFDSEQYKTPEIIQKYVNAVHGTTSFSHSNDKDDEEDADNNKSLLFDTNDPTFYTSMSVNWANFYRDLVQIHPDMEHDIHFPLYSGSVLSKHLPYRVSAINLFTANIVGGRRRAGAFVLCNELVWKNYIAQCGIVDEMIAET